MKRSTAEEAMMAMKNHPLLKATVGSLEQRFYRIDDVCQLTISDEIRTLFAQREHMMERS